MATIDPPDSSQPTEADIHAYADGILAAERAERLRHYLTHRSNEARRVAFYSKLNAQFKRTFQPVGEPVPVRSILACGWRGALKRVLSPNARGNTVRALYVLVLAFVTLSGWIVASQVSDEALSDAAVMVLARVSSNPPDAVPLTLAASNDKAAPDLSPVGLRFTERRTVALGPISRASEFVYVNSTGQPVVLLVSRALLAQEQPKWSALRVGDIRLLTWVTRRQRYMLAGDADTHGLMLAADFMTLH
ncbi:anti-sigma factor family protein [Burkholderia anthina]|uniref:anti-sigma factor family protein n=1 Tax=Burkholderia anthina TaxID=179879 RepID=UPI001AA09B2E|nr:transcriptional regulator [Burkholderia anthina]QTD94778.1 transcriptional regulator [Burkholderia anthina]